MVLLTVGTILGTNVDGVFSSLEFQRLYASDFFESHVLRQSEPWNFKYSKAFLLRKTVTKQCVSVTF